MKNNEEKVHVRAYVKDDGTHVKEHYRGLPDAEYAQDDDFPNQMQDQMEKATKNSVNCAEKLSAILSKSKYIPNHNNLDYVIQELQTAHNSQSMVMKKILDRMLATKSQKEYSRLQNTYIRQRNFLKKSDVELRKILYWYEKGNQHEVQEATQEYTSIYKEEIQRYNNLHDYRRSLFSKQPNRQKILISNTFRLLEKTKNCHDANNLWKLSVQGLDSHSDYIKKNGKVISSVSDLPPKLKSFVTKKIKTQIYKSDCKGVYFHTNSSLSKEISHSAELKQYARKNIQALAAGNNISEGSVNFTSDNLHLALGHADIIDMHLDENNNLRAYVIDTYDFNEDDPDWRVNWAYNIQEHGLITNYYTITEISVPADIWTRI